MLGTKMFIDYYFVFLFSSTSGRYKQGNFFLLRLCTLDF